jgi:adenosylmethionine-8-amino-7-oxononanoate aminotransferase
MSQTHVINSQLICANYTKDYPMIEKGVGSYLYDKEGKKYLDTCGCTAAVTSIGHGNEEVAKVIAEQTQKLSVHPTHLFYNQELEDYLTNICDFAPEGFNHAWTICGGTEALENSIKLAYQYHRSKGNRRTKIIGRWGSYHGNSLTMLDVGGMVARREYYTDLMVNHLHVSPCNLYRIPNGMSEQEYEDSLIAEFEKTLNDNKDDVVCFIAEPIVGAALGAMGPTKNYYQRIYELCQKHDVLFISDEVMTGFGRTGKNFGIEHFGQADILACAKSISGGYFPIGAVIAHDRVLNPIRESEKPFFSGQTYSCIPIAAAVGNKVLEIIKKENLVENSAKMGSYIIEQLEGLKDINTVGDVRGKGLFFAIEFVKDQKTKDVIEPTLMYAKTVEKHAMKNGLATYGARGTVEYTKGDHMLFAPPLNLSKAEADEIVVKMRQSILDANQELGL